MIGAKSEPVVMLDFGKIGVSYSGSIAFGCQINGLIRDMLERYGDNWAPPKFWLSHEAIRWQH